MTNIGVKYKLHQVLSLRPRSQPSSPFSLSCFHLALLQISHTECIPEPLGLFCSTLWALTKKWLLSSLLLREDEGVNKDTMICEMSITS